MTVKERIIAALDSSPGPVCDDCMKELAKLSARQVSHQACTAMAAQGTISRSSGTCQHCGRTKIVNWCEDRTGGQINATPGAQRATKGTPSKESRKLWYWEGNVQSRIVAWLSRIGYDIQAEADTAARTPGKDVVAQRDGRQLWVTVKGYPVRSANTQARHWFAGALLDLALYRQEDAEVELAMAFPAGFATYENLIKRMGALRSGLSFRVFLVREDGSVTED